MQWREAILICGVASAIAQENEHTRDGKRIRIASTM